MVSRLQSVEIESACKPIIVKRFLAQPVVLISSTTVDTFLSRALQTDDGDQGPVNCDSHNEYHIIKVMPAIISPDTKVPYLEIKSNLNRTGIVTFCEEYTFMPPAISYPKFVCVFELVLLVLL